VTLPLSYSRAAAFLVECTAPLQTCIERLRLRGPDPVRVDLTPGRVESLVRSFPFTRLGLVLDTAALDPAECVRMVERWLDEARATDLARWGLI
jgi:hypothetical protein